MAALEEKLKKDRFTAEDARELKKEILEWLGKTEADVAREPRLGLQIEFFISAMTPYSKFKTVPQILDWLEGFRKNNKNVVELIPVKAMKKWYLEEKTGNIRHDSGKFFSIEGVKTTTQDRELRSWCQPIMNQPEVGILGIIVKKIDGLYYFLMQAKTEPGNIDAYQISPTVQATKSNYTKVHGGKLPPFVEVFLDRAGGKHKIIFEKLQSEEGARFWKKNNLNMLLEVGEKEFEEVPPEFCWITLHQLKQLLLKSNIVNACARSVLSCLP